MNPCDTEEGAGSAVILRFTRKRGRPKNPPRPQTDLGTPELAMKRALGVTTEALDLCLERSIIDARQHWCGIHLRWLFTLRHGAPSVRAMDPTHIPGLTVKNDDPEWRAAREKEFHDVMMKLAASGHAPLLMNLCVYNERPGFLNLCKPISEKNYRKAAETLAQLRDGLDILATHWKRREI